jgi:hypothetical protein
MHHRRSRSEPDIDVKDSVDDNDVDEVESVASDTSSVHTVDL